MTDSGRGAAGASSASMALVPAEIKNGEVMEMSNVITISGQHGSGRKELGEMIASSLGVPFYGDNLAAMIAEEGKVDLSLVEAMDQVEPDTEEASVLHVAQNRTSLTKTIYQAQESVIRRLAGEGPCVILERCSETILPDAVNIFVYGDLEYRIGRIMKVHPELSRYSLKSHVLSVDNRRKSYCETYAPGKWGRMETYDICLNAGLVGLDGCLKVTLEYIRGVR